MGTAVQSPHPPPEAMRVPEPVRDAEGFDLRPDPLDARTGAELVEMLRAYRIWAGQPSFRVIAARTWQKVGYSTLCTALGSTRLPSLDVVMAVIIGCGADEEYQRRWATAWRKIKFQRVDAQPLTAGSKLQALPSGAESRLTA
jgi:hypothetical protein